MDVADSFAQAARDAARLDEDELYRRIGIVANAADPENVGELKPVNRLLAETRGDEADFLGIGRAIATKVNKQARELVCGSGDDFKEEREEFQKALKDGVEKLSESVAAFLLATGVGLPAAAVAWVAGVIAKIIINAGGDVLCDAWKAPA
jgi:hypothetical protein